MIKDLLKRALRLYGRSVLASVVGAFLYLSIGVITHALTPNSATLSRGGSFLMNLVALLMQGFMFVMIVYSEMRGQGDKDSGRHLFHGEAEDPHRGLWVGLLATAPAILAYVVLLAEKLFGFFPGYAMWYRVGQLALYPLIVWSMGSLWNTPASQISWGGLAGAAVPLLVMPLVSWISYYWGYKQVAIGERLVYGKQNKKR